jgi:hypothetical protein
MGVGFSQIGDELLRGGGAGGGIGGEEPEGEAGVVDPPEDFVVG